jgi:hypothetical protein
MAEQAVVEAERKMSVFNATMIAEGVEEVEDEETYLAAWQVLVDTGTCWSLQGWFGRTAMDLIQSGRIKGRGIGSSQRYLTTGR